MNGTHGALPHGASVFVIFGLSSVSAFLTALLLLAVAG